MAPVKAAALFLAILLAGCGDGRPAERQPEPVSGNGQAEGHDWATFLGPEHTGVSRETGLLKSWPEKGPPLRWQAELGETYAVPSVAKDALIVFHRVRDEEVVERWDATTGRKAWRFSYATSYEDRFGYNNGPRGAPTIDGDRVYTLGAEGQLHCLELETGKLVWGRPLHAEYFKEARQNFFGVGVAPRIDGDLILLNLGDEVGGCVTGIDKKTGKTAWRVDGDGASYSTAFCASVGKTRQAFFLTREGGLACDVADGKLRWRYPFRSREKFSANAASPIVFDNHLFLTAAYGVGSALLKLEEGGVKEVWRNDALGSHWATPIHVGGYLYGFDGRHEYEAELRCVRVSDGKVVWSRNGYERGSMILAEGKFIILAENGRLVLADLSPQRCKELSSFKPLGRHCWAAPLLSRGLLYVKDFNHKTGKATLLCFDLRAR